MSPFWSAGVAELRSKTTAPLWPVVFPRAGFQALHDRRHRTSRERVRGRGARDQSFPRERVAIGAAQEMWCRQPVGTIRPGRESEAGAVCSASTQNDLVVALPRVSHRAPSANDRGKNNRDNQKKENEHVMMEFQ